ncbi:hypothetical protein KHP62_05900 [Rhodobacteraceae bacterium NNCM2]|nr:hypothetical protein [Coraliihabitans acroporae]
MAAGAYTFGLIGAAMLAGCGSSSGAPSLAPVADAEDHPDMRLYVHYGAMTYFVDVRYVDMIQESVIAVRETGGKLDGREELTVPATIGIPTGEPFSSSAFKPLAVSIADYVRESARVCVDGAKMALRLNSDGETRASYRSGRGAWVVFAACEAPVMG